jgi:hypothetical protein
MTAPKINKPAYFSIIGIGPYNLINLILAGIVFCIFIYAAVFSPIKNNYPIHSFHDSLTGGGSISTGLSRGFSNIMRGRLREATDNNIYSIRIFTFFLIQFIMRCTLFLVTRRKSNQVVVVIRNSDVLVSIGLFIIFFYPFLKDAFTNI